MQSPIVAATTIGNEPHDKMAFHFAWYNLVGIHNSLGITPAMAAGVSGTLWKMEDIVP